jgi:hypothetical protein
MRARSGARCHAFSRERAPHRTLPAHRRRSYANVREVSELLAAWNSFYVMIGSAAAALTGLMFVVITLVSGDKRRAAEEGVSTFSSPTVVHFCGALFTSALMSAPFRSLAPIAIVLGTAGAAGLYLVALIALRTWKISTYRPDAEDWIWHVILPFVAYAALVTGAIAMHGSPRQALFAPAVAVLFLIFIGIHNAWDVVTYIATGKGDAPPDRADTGGASDESR